MRIDLAEAQNRLHFGSYEEMVRRDKCSPVMHIERQATIQAIHHVDAGRIVDLAQRRVDKERRCHRANMVHKGQYLALQKRWVPSTGTEVVRMSVDLGRSNVALCCNVAEASDSRLNPLQGRNSAADDVVSRHNQAYRPSTIGVADHIVAVADVVKMFFCC
jgi:hypothetical protein